MPQRHQLSFLPFWDLLSENRLFYPGHWARKVSKKSLFDTEGDTVPENRIFLIEIPIYSTNFRGGVRLTPILGDTGLGFLKKRSKMIDQATNF